MTKLYAERPLCSIMVDFKLPRGFEQIDVDGTIYSFPDQLVIDAPDNLLVMATEITDGEERDKERDLIQANWFTDAEFDEVMKEGHHYLETTSPNGYVVNRIEEIDHEGNEGEILTKRLGIETEVGEDGPVYSGDTDGYFIQEEEQFRYSNSGGHIRPLKKIPPST